MADWYTHSEYHDVLRVDADSTTLSEAGYRFFEADKVSLNTMLYARDTTLARGRILYEVWDNWKNLFLGYIVPQDIFVEARANRESPSLASWANLPGSSRNLHYQTHYLVIERFPRIPLLSSKLIVEALVSGRESVPPAHIVEEAVVEHAKHCWTSYDFRVTSQGQSPQQAAKIVRKRTREILESWLPLEISWYNMVAVWTKHDLLEEDGKNGILFEENKVLLGRPTLVHWYAGAETNANLISASALPPL